MGQPAARLLDPTGHGLPLTPGPGSLNVLIGGMPAWRGLPAGAGAGVAAAVATADTAIKIAEAATIAGAATPGGPALLTAELKLKADSLIALTSLMSSFAGMSDTHVCPLPAPAPLPPHGPGMVIKGSMTVMVNNMPLARMGDQVLEALGGPDPIAMGCPTVLVGG